MYMSRRIKVSPNQRPMFQIDENENVTYFYNGFPQTLEEAREYDPDFEIFDPDIEEDPLQLLGYNTEAENHKDISKIEKEDDRTVLISISDLEKIKRILTSIPQFRDLASQMDMDVNSIEFLAYAVENVDFLSLPMFDVDMSIFDILVKNNDVYREFVFGTILDLVNFVSETGKFPTRKYLKSIFIDFGPEEIDIVYQLIKRFLNMLNAWSGIQLHLFEQTIRDWLYIVYERGCLMNLEEIFVYLKGKYPCKADYELQYIAHMLAQSVAFNPNLDEFVSEFTVLMHSFTPEQNQYLTADEVNRLWNSEGLRRKIKEAAEKWRSRIETTGISTNESELDQYFGVKGRLSDRIRKGTLPQEVFAIDSINESVIKLKLYFPEGYRTLIEARIDRLVRFGGSSEIFDWKSSRKEIEEMNDFEKLQIILQAIAVQSAILRTREGTRYTPMENNDYKFFITSTSSQYIDGNSLPSFSHVPLSSDQIFDYVSLEISPEEVSILINAFGKIVNFLICNKRQLAKLRRHLKNIDSYIPAPKLIPASVELDSVTYAYQEAVEA